MRKRKKRLADYTIEELHSQCSKTNDCTKCRFLEVCGIPFGALTKKQLGKDYD